MAAALATSSSGRGGESKNLNLAPTFTKDFYGNNEKVTSEIWMNEERLLKNVGVTQQRVQRLLPMKRCMLGRASMAGINFFGAQARVDEGQSVAGRKGGRGGTTESDAKTQHQNANSEE